MTVSEQIIQVLDALCEKLGLAIDWTSENVLPYLTTLCGKLISYEIWTSAFWIVFMTVLTIASVIATKRLYPVFKNGVKNQDWTECGWSVATGVSIAGLIAFYIASFAVIASQMVDIIKCITFPEMFIFEYIQSAINAGG